MAVRILIAEGMATHRIALASILKSARHETLSLDCAKGLVDAAAEFGPRAILLDRDLSGGSAAALKALKSDHRTRGIPVIVTLAENLPTHRLEALVAGADEVLARPIAPVPLLARLRSLMRARDATTALASRALTVRGMGFAEEAVAFDPPGRVALVGTDRVEAPWFNGLPRSGRLSFRRLDPEQVLGTAEDPTPPDLYVIAADSAAPGDTFRLVADLRTRTQARHAAILVIHSADDPDTGAMALDVGANDVLPDDVEPEEVSLRIGVQLRQKQTADRLRQAVEERLRLALEDPLTGLYNRRYAIAHLERALDASPTPEGLCVLVADLDHFKSVNDRFGHGAGDRVLTEVAHRLRDNLRSPDMVARIGGEEFLIVLSGTDPDAAFCAAERLRGLVRNQPVQCPGVAAPIPITISLGLTMVQPGDSPDSAIARADAALYRAKDEGRDTVTVASRSAA